MLGELELGAVKVTEAAVALDKVTDGPEVCAQAQLNVSPSGSVDPEASNVTDAPAATGDGALMTIAGATLASTVTDTPVHSIHTIAVDITVSDGRSVFQRVDGPGP